MEGLRKGYYHAIAYGLNGDYTVIDLDDCIHGGDITHEARLVVDRCHSYTEYSISRTGLHTILANKGRFPGRNRRGLEVYASKRFIICTGDHVEGTPADIRPNPEALVELASTDGLVTERTESAESSETSDAIPPRPDAWVPAETLTIDEVITRTLPLDVGRRNQCIFSFARGLKFNAHTAGLPLKELKPYVRRWHEQALDTIRTKPFDETWGDFIVAHRKARSPLGDMIGPAWEAARSGPPCPQSLLYDDPRVRLLINVIHRLAVVSGGQFFCSTHDAGRRLGVNAMQVHRWFGMLEVDGIIAPIQRGDSRQRRATRYRWTGEA